MKQKYVEEYLKQIYTVQDFIEKNPTEFVNVESLTKISGLSQFHFHRIFKALTGESIYEFIVRVKAEWALGMLMHRPDLSITDISFELGFSDSAVFSRSFKRYYGVSPTGARKDFSKNRKVILEHKVYNDKEDENIVNPRSIELRFTKQFHLIYKRTLGAYSQLKSSADTIQELHSVAKAENVLDETSMPLIMYHTNPEISSEDNYRTTIGFFIREPIRDRLNSSIASMILEAGYYAIFSFELDVKDFEGAWSFIYKEWFPKSGYLPRNAPPFEVYTSNPNDHSPIKYHVDIYIPVIPS